VKSLRITLKKRDPSARATSSEHDVQSASSSEPVDSQDGESENASDKDEDTDGTPPTRTSTRLASKSTKNLPFSPRKTRASRHFVTHGEEDAATPSDEERPRRITSSRAPQDSDDEAEVVPSSSDESVVYVSRGKGKGKGKGKGRAPPPILVPVPPVLNRVCSVDDLEEDADPETTSLRTHRSACEKCGQGPVHLALKKKGRRRKLEEFEEEDDILGGWLRWWV
jgi:chromodomain-helicase-DNA-binding protein 4